MTLCDLERSFHILHTSPAEMCSSTAFSRSRPEVFEAKAEDLEAKVEASDLCDEGQSSVGYTKGVESTG